MHIRRSFQRFGSFLLLWIAAAAAPQPKPAPKYELVDGHLHFLNFVQETAGMDAFLKAMDDRIARSRQTSDRLPTDFRP